MNAEHGLCINICAKLTGFIIFLVLLGEILRSYMGQIKRNVLYNVALSVSQVLVPVIVFPYVSRVLGPEGIGSIGFMESITQYFILFAALGIPIYGVREIAKVRSDKVQRSKLFSELLLIHCVTTLLLSVVFLLLLLHVPQLNRHFQLGMIGLGMLYVQAFMVEWLFQGLEEFSFIAIRTVLIRIVSIVLIFVFVSAPGDAAIYYGIMLVTGGLNMLINMAYARRYIGLVFTELEFRRHFKSLLYIFSFGIVVSVYTVLDTAILGFLSDVKEVGYYNTSLRLTKLVITVLTSFAIVMVPPLAQAFNGDNKAYALDLLNKSFAYMTLIGVPAGVGLFVFAPGIIGLFAGSDFELSVSSLRILAPSIIIIGFSNIFGMQILNPSNNEALFFRAALVGMLVSLPSNLLLVPSLGQIGTAAASVITEAVVLMLLVAFSRRVIAFKPNWSQLVKTLIATTVFVPIAYLFSWLEMDETVALLGGILVSMATYFAIQHWVWRHQLTGAVLTIALRKLKDARG